MRLIRHILLCILTMICVVFNATADCTQGKITLKNGYNLVKTVKSNECKVLNAVISDKKATAFKLTCSNSKFKCIAHSCPNNLTPDKNGICSSINPTEQTRFHKGLVTHTYQKRNFYDACVSFNPAEVKNKTILETSSVITELGKKIKYACVTDFAGYNLSTALAIGLIERYKWSNDIGQIRADNCTTQQHNRFKSGNGRSIRCFSDNGVFVEFIFGRMDALYTTREDVAGALCPAFGFQHMDANGMKHYCHNGSKSKSYDELAKFLRKNELMDIKNIDNGYFEIIPLRSNAEKKDDISKILDTDLFKPVMTHAVVQIKILLKQHIMERMKAAGYQVQSIKFYSARSKSFSTTEGSTWPVEISACKKNDCKNHIKLFKFRSLNGGAGADLHFAGWTYLGVEEMACLLKDGMFDSKHCFFLEEDINNEKKKCTDTNTLIQKAIGQTSNSAKAEFDTQDNMCVLKTSNANAKALQTLNIAVQVGALAITTVMTAGAGSVLAMSIMGAGLLADGLALYTDIKMNKSSVKFLKLSTRCFDAKCAKKYFEEEFKHMLRLMDKVNDDEFKVIDNEMNRLVDLLDDKYIGDTYNKGLEELKKDTTGILKNMSTEEAVNTAATIVSLALSAANAVKGVKLLLQRSKIRAPKFLKKLDIRINQCPTCNKNQFNALVKQREDADIKALPAGKNTAKKADGIKALPASSTTTAVTTTKSANVAKIDNELDAISDSGITTFTDLSPDDAEHLKQVAKERGLEVQYHDGLKQYTVRKSSTSAAKTEVTAKTATGKKAEPTTTAKASNKNKSSNKTFNINETRDSSKITATANSAPDASATQQSKPIGVLTSYSQKESNLPQIIENLKKDGFRVEEFNIEGVNEKGFRVFADGEQDIEKAQQRLLNTATSKTDVDARLSIVGQYYNPSGNPESWYTQYDESVREMLSHDADVEKARKNWDNMSEWDKYKFEHQTNRKIRRFINPEATPAGYEMTPEFAAAAYNPQRIGSEAEKTAKALDGVDLYNINPKNDTFEKAMENLVHENYHYAQDIGKTETPKWLLDFNMDNYTISKEGAGGFYGAYNEQPLEIGVKALGEKTNIMFTEKNVTENIRNVQETAGKFAVSNDANQRKLGQDIQAFFANPTPQTHETMRSTIRDVRYMNEPGDETRDFIDSFYNMDFQDYTRDIANGTVANPVATVSIETAPSSANKIDIDAGFNMGDKKIAANIDDAAKNSNRPSLLSGGKSAFENQKQAINERLDKIQPSDLDVFPEMSDEANIYLRQAAKERGLDISYDPALEQYTVRSKKVTTTENLKQEFNMGTTDTPQTHRSDIKVDDATFDAAQDANNVATLSPAEIKAANVAGLRKEASAHFDEYLAEAKQNGKSSHLIPKDRLTDAGWDTLTESLAQDDIYIVDVTANGKPTKQLVRGDLVRSANSNTSVATPNRATSNASNNSTIANNIGNATSDAISKNFSSTAKNFINDINQVGATKEYAILKNETGKLSQKETDYINQLLNNRDDLITGRVSQPDGQGGTLGKSWIVIKNDGSIFNRNGQLVRKVATKPIEALKGKSITTINGRPVFLETLDNGNIIGAVGGRPVVVVNYNGHRIPFYASSGSAGKLDVPTGKWEVFFGFGGSNSPNPYWFNKGSINAIVDHYNSPELKKIANALDDLIGDQRNIEDVFATASRKAFNGKGSVASYDGPAASEEFINKLLDFTPVTPDASKGVDLQQLQNNINHVKRYFRYN